MIKIAILGLGVVGGGVADVINTNSAIISAQVGEPVEIKYILDIKDFSGHPLERFVVRDIDAILSDPEISVVAETMGGAHPAYDFSLKAIRAGKHVVTSNKEVVATFGSELMAEARKAGVRYLFEASVGGGIPIIRPMLESLAGNDISEVCGILNGTTNYILTKMNRCGVSFECALSEAQSAGYAERNPSADIDGLDSCRKICILAGIAFGSIPSPDMVYTRGITGVTPRDLADAPIAGCSLKLIGRAFRGGDGGVAVSVEPCFVGTGNPLSGIEDVYNGILVRGNALGDVMFYGMGAGKLPTASAVVSDIIDIARSGSSGVMANWKCADASAVSDDADTEADFYVRLPRKIAAPELSSSNGEYSYRQNISRNGISTAYPDAAAVYRII